MSNELNIVLAGVGGQGTLVAGKLLGTVAQKQNLDFKVSEVHGMSQRGGSVITYVRMGKKVYSPVIEKGMADFILAFEELEALRWINLLKKEKYIIVNKQQIMPATVLTGAMQYPEKINEKLVESGVDEKNLISIPAYKIANELGNIRTVNIVMIGAMSLHTNIDESIWIEAIKEVFPIKLQEINLKAFKSGRKFAQDK